MNKKLFAFWRYGFQVHTGFNGVIGSEVTSMNGRGAVETKEFGPGQRFMPVRVMPLKEGQALHRLTEKLRAEYTAEVNAVTQKFALRFKELFDG